jgi:putative salt-induced outer membrane protein YdiY
MANSRYGAHRRLWRAWLGGMLVLHCTAIPTQADPKTDVIVLTNGDRITGEIKSVEAAILTLSTDAAGTITIDWVQVASLTSVSNFQFEMTNGNRYFGSLQPGEKDGDLKIIDGSEIHEVKLMDVVGLAPIEHGFWKRLDGSLDAGLSFTQSNQAVQYSFSADVRNRTRKRLSTLGINSIFNNQEGGDSSSQHYASFRQTQFVKTKRNVFWLAELQSNPDQGYSLRSVIGGGAGRFFVHTNRELFNFSSGLVYDREEVTGSDQVDNSAEVLLGLEYGSFRYAGLKRVVTLTLNTFTNVIDTPRLRVQLNFKTNWEIVNNFNFCFSILESYDSEPPTDDAAENDLSLVTSFGYSF